MKKEIVEIWKDGEFAMTVNCRHSEFQTDYTELIVNYRPFVAKYCIVTKEIIDIAEFSDIKIFNQNK
jgi:hypothetical protein